MRLRTDQAVEYTSTTLDVLDVLSWPSFHVGMNIMLQNNFSATLLVLSMAYPKS